MRRWTRRARRSQAGLAFSVRAAGGGRTGGASTTDRDLAGDGGRTFRPAPWLAGPFRQTVASALWPVRGLRSLPAPHRQEVSVSGPEQLGVLVTESPSSPAPGGGPPLGRLLLLHGLGGSARSRYMLRAALVAHARGWEVARLHFRGAEADRPGGRTFHNAGRSEDVAAAVAQTRWSRRAEGTPLAVAGFSLGGAVLLKHLAESASRTPIAAAAAVSPPIDLAASLALLEQPHNRLYHWYYTARMRTQIRAKVAAHPDALPRLEPWMRSVRALDEVYTVPDAGYATSDAYYEGASSNPRLGSVAVPTLLLASRDDPFVPAESFEGLGSTAGTLETRLTEAGGHMGYLSARGRGVAFWAIEEVVAWLESRVVS